MRNRNHHRAFTLVELVLVMVVIAVVAAMVMPSLSGTARGRRLGDTANQIVALARMARTQSVTEGKMYRLNIDPNGGSGFGRVCDSGQLVVFSARWRAGGMQPAAATGRFVHRVQADWPVRSGDDLCA
jgi:prepilin-type N-terminal cleavage/methylation domain-containing protein